MTRVHLDTSFLINALIPETHEDKLLSAWVRQRRDVAMSVVAWAEFLCGPVTEVDRHMSQRLIGLAIALGEVDAAKAADLFDVGGRRRGSLDDCLIAATAIRAEAELATSNIADFRRFEKAGLKLAGD